MTPGIQPPVAGVVLQYALDTVFGVNEAWQQRMAQGIVGGRIQLVADGVQQVQTKAGIVQPAIFTITNKMRGMHRTVPVFLNAVQVRPVGSYLPAVALAV